MDIGLKGSTRLISHKLFQHLVQVVCLQMGQSGAPELNETILPGCDQSSWTVMKRVHASLVRPKYFLKPPDGGATAI